MCQPQNRNMISTAITPSSQDEEAPTPVAPPSVEKDREAEEVDKFLTYVVVGIMPFLYGGATRLPFIYFVIHLSVHFELNWWIIGLCVGAYQSGRVLINIVCIWYPKSAHFWGTALGFAGYTTVFVSNNNNIIPFIAGTAIIGFSETMACMQKYAKDMFKYDADAKKTQRMLKYQYASVMVGVMFAFSLGGVIYQYFGINGVALFGMFVEGFGLLALVYFVIMRRKTPSTTPQEPVALHKEESLLPEKCQVTQQSAANKSVKTKATTTSSSLPVTSSYEQDALDSTQFSYTHGEDDDDSIDFYPKNGDSKQAQDDASIDAEIGLMFEEAEEDLQPPPLPRSGSPALFDSQILTELEELETELEELKSGNDNDEILVTEATSASSEMDITPESLDQEILEALEELQQITGGGTQETAAESSSSPAPKESGAVKDKTEKPVEESEVVRSKPLSDQEEDDIEMAVASAANTTPQCIVDSSDVEQEEVSVLGMAAVTDVGTMTVPMTISYANANYHTSDIPATWLNYLVCVSFGIEALTIGYNLSIGPIFILNVFDVNTGITGFLFGIGAGTGAIIAIGVTCTQFGNRLMRKIAKCPYDLCFAMGGIAIGVFVASIQYFPAHIVGLLLLMSFNDLGATLLTEFQGSITTVSNYSVLGPLGQVVRRSLNVVTAVTGPILYGFYPSLPYIVAGTITLLWSIMLVIAFKFRATKTAQDLAQTFGRSDRSVCSMMSFQTMELVRSMSFAVPRRSACQ